MKKTKIVVLGGGFAGLYAAMRLCRMAARRADVDVTVINRTNYILFTPMLHEVVVGDLYPLDITNPIRGLLHHAKFVEAEVRAIDLSARRVRCTSGIAELEMEFEFDHLLIALGSETNFFDLPGVSDWAITMKTLRDATVLRNMVLALLEEANLHTDPAEQQQLLTFLIAGGGFTGVETGGALNDFLREAVKFYPQLNKDVVRVIIVQGGDVLLPELGEKLGHYAERKLLQRKVEVIKHVRVAGYDGSSARLSNGQSIPAGTLIWTAGVKPSPAIAALPCHTEHGRLVVNEFLAVPGYPGLWAVGDCAAVPDLKTGKLQPPTAQHGLREGVVVADNIVATILGRPLKPFTFTTLGQLAAIGHRTGVAMVFGMTFSGFLAWLMWRTIYLAKLPQLSKKLRVMMGWTLDLMFSKDIEQLVSVRDVQAMARMADRRIQRLQRKAA